MKKIRFSTIAKKGVRVHKINGYLQNHGFLAKENLFTNHRIPKDFIIDLPDEKEGKALLDNIFNLFSPDLAIWTNTGRIDEGYPTRVIFANTRSNGTALISAAYAEAFGLELLKGAAFDKPFFNLAGDFAVMGCRP